MKQDIAKTAVAMISRLDSDSSSSKAILASLRGCNSILDRKATAVWPLMFENLTEENLSKTGKPTAAEKALFSVLKLYAIYRQSNSTETSYRSAFTKEQPGLMFFSALARLRQNEQVMVALDRRVQAVLASTNYKTAINGVYSLMQILHGRTPNLKIDFAQLAVDLYIYQLNFESARSVCLHWGEQYFITLADKD